MLEDANYDINRDYIRLIVLSHDPDPGASTHSLISFFSRAQHQGTVYFSWPTFNFIVYVKTFKEFPVGKREGEFYSIEIELEEMTWKYDESTRLYQLTFLDSNKYYSITASQEQIVQFGHALEAEMIGATIEYYDDEADEFDETDETDESDKAT